MVKSYCTHYPNCTSLARKFSIRQDILNARINAYNMFLPEGEERISASKNYTDEELEDIYNKLQAHKDKLGKDPKYITAERRFLEKSMGGPEAFALHEASQRFSGEEISQITQEITRAMLDILVREASKYKGATIEDVLKKGRSTFQDLIEGVVGKYKVAFAHANSVLSGHPVPGSHIQTVEQAEQIRNLLIKLFQPTEIGGNLITSMVVLALPTLNDVLDVKVHANFTVDANNNVAYELADSIRDMEEPQQERYQQALDAQTLESSLSTIIARVVMQIPPTKTVVKTVDIDDGKGNIIPTTSQHSEVVTTPILGLPAFSRVSTMTRQLADMLSGVTSEGDVLRALAKFKDDSQFGELYNKLITTPRLLTTFFQDFNKYNQICRGVTLENNSDGTVKASAVPLNTGSKNSGVSPYFTRLRLGNVSPNSIFKVVEENGEKRITLNYGKSFIGLKDRFKALFLEGGDKSVFRKASLPSQEGMLTQMLEALNFPVNIDIIRDILSDVSKQQALIEALDRYFTVGETVLSGNTSRVRLAMSGSEDMKSAIGTIMQLTQPAQRRQSSKQVKYAGSTISSMILNSPYSILTKKLNNFYDTKRVKEDGTTVEINTLSDYLNSKYLNSEQYRNSEGVIFSRWLADFMECRELPPSKPSMKSLFGITRDLGINDIKFEEINDKQHMLMFVMGYLGGRNWLEATNVKLINDESEINTKSQVSNVRQVLLGSARMYYNNQWTYRDDPAYIPSFITGDTNALRQIRTIHYYLPEILDGMYNLYLADRANQDTIKEFNRRGIVFSANGKEAYTSKQVKIDGKKTRRSNENVFGILQFLNQPMVDGTTWYEYFQALGGTKEAFRQVANEYLNEGFKEFKLQLEELGLLDKTAEGKYIYFNDFLGKNEDTKEQVLNEILFDFYANYKFGEYNQAHLMHVNPSFFNTVEEHQKRNKGTLTNGATLSMEAKDENKEYIWDYDPKTGTFDFNSKVVYFKDVKTGLDKGSYDALLNYFTNVFNDEEAAKEYLKDNFSKNSLTDGQAYRSFESYRKVLKSAGLSYWSERQEDAYNRIMELVTPIREARKQGEIKSLTVDELQEIQDLMVEMQPIKPINDGIETFGSSNIKVGFQFKYAEVPLLPELFPVGSKLRELGDEMVDRNIDLLASDKCLKKGCFGEIDLQYKMVNGKYVDANGELLPGMDENGKIIDDGTQTAGQQRANPNNEGRFVEWESNTSVKSIFNAHTKEDGMSEFIIHTIPMENYLIQSNIPDHTDGNSTLGTQGRKIGTGAIVDREDYHYTIGNKGENEGQQISGKKLARIYGIAHALKYISSFKTFTGRLDNTSEAIEDIVYNILNSGRGNIASISKLTLVDGTNPTIPFAEPSNSRNINSNIISIFKKTVIRQLISGGSIVQASSMGYGKEALKDTGLHAIIKDGIPIGMQTEMPFDFHYVDENGNRVPLKYEDYCDENGYFLDGNGKAITEDRYGDDDAIPKIEIDFPGITDIIAYRIPTEMEYSMFHLKIVKCNPKAAANTIKLPAECTSIAGFDFDIDKLFLMRHNFKGQAIDNKTVWEYIYNNNESLKQAFYEKWLENGRPNNVDFHEYWDEVMQERPSWDAEYGKKSEYFQKAKAELQKSKMQNSHIDYDSLDIKTLASMSQSDLDNIIIDCMVSILSDESTLKDRYTPGGFPQSSEDAKLMRLLEDGQWDPDEESFNKFVKRASKLEDVLDSRDYSEPMTSIAFKEQNQIAGTLIGIFANDNVNNFISKGLKLFRIVNPNHRILFGSLKDGITELDGKSDNIDSSDIGLSFLHSTVNGVSIKRTLAELLAASVDAVKDPVLNFLNLNSITADAAAMLARLGYTTRDIGLLFNQPVIKEMCKFMNRSGESNCRRALSKVLGDMGVKLPSTYFGYKAAIDDRWLTSENLAKNLSKNSSPDVNSQIAVAQLFNSIMQTKSEFSNYVQQTRNTSANTVKSRFEDYISSNDKSDRSYRRILIRTNEDAFPITRDMTLEDLTDDKKILELLEKYKDHPFIYENVVANIIDRAMAMMMDKYTVLNTPLYEGYRRVLSSLIAPWGVGADQMELLHQDLPTIILSSLPGELNPAYTMEGQDVCNALRYLLVNYGNEDEEDPNKNGFIMKLNDLMNEDSSVANNPIIKILDAREVKGSQTLVELVPTHLNSLDSWEQFNLTTGWDQLMSKYPEIAKGLFIYFYYKSGLNPSYNRMLELAPASVLQSIIVDEPEGLSYADFFDRSNKLYSTKLDTASNSLEIKKNLYQFIMAHSDDPKIVKTVDTKIDKNITELIFTVPKKGEAEPERSADLVKLQDFIGPSGFPEGAYYAPVIKVQGMLYVMAKSDCGEYTIDYNSLKSIGERTIMYVPVTNDAIRTDIDDLTIKLKDLYNQRNGIIFKYNRSTLDVGRLIGNDDVQADYDSTQSSSTEEGYDDAKERTKDDDVTSSDGKKKCIYAGK